MPAAGVDDLRADRFAMVIGIRSKNPPGAGREGAYGSDRDSVRLALLEARRLEIVSAEFEKR